MLDSSEQHFVPGHVTLQKGLSASPKGVHCTTQLDTSLWGSIMGSNASSAATAESLCPLLTPLPNIFCFCEERRDQLVGKKTQALITQRGTGVGEAAHHHSAPPPDLYKRVSLQGAIALWEGRHSCYTNIANTDTAAHTLPPPETGAQSRISCPRASFLQLFP